ncbi:MAG: RNA 3'-terminal phosphate cyclase [Candidatus Paceibacteria bacterium]
MSYSLPLQIDGSIGSGGGQIVRTALALAAVTQQSCRLFNIRTKRPNPGLQAQHIATANAICKLCKGVLEGERIGSQELVFYPGPLNQIPNLLYVKLDTAASITLLLQALVPLALQASKPVRIVFEGGGTDTFFSPTLDYWQYVFLKILEKMGVRTEINIKRRGYYPRGGAQAEVLVYPAKLQKLSLATPGPLQKIIIFSGAAKELKPRKVAERQIAGSREILAKLKLPLEERVSYWPADCAGSHFCIAAYFENTVIGADKLGTLGKKAEDIGRETALEILKLAKNPACLDKHMTDQILIYLALAGGGKITVPQITPHAAATQKVIEQFLPGRFVNQQGYVEYQRD